MDFLTRGLLAADWADWATALAYAIAAVLCWRASRHAAQLAAARERLFWLGCTLAMPLLGINELFDFQTLATMTAKEYAKASGWYESRRTVQLIFVAVFAAAALGTLATLGWFVRRMGRPVKIAFGGLVLIGLFIVLRAATFHHLVEVIAIGPALTGATVFAEITGIAMVALAAHFYRSSSHNEGT